MVRADPHRRQAFWPVSTWPPGLRRLWRMTVVGLETRGLEGQQARRLATVEVALAQRYWNPADLLDGVVPPRPRLLYKREAPELVAPGPRESVSPVRSGRRHVNPLRERESVRGIS